MFVCTTCVHVRMQHRVNDTVPGRLASSSSSSHRPAVPTAPHREEIALALANRVCAIGSTAGPLLPAPRPPPPPPSALVPPKCARGVPTPPDPVRATPTASGSLKKSSLLKPRVKWPSAPRCAAGAAGVVAAGCTQVQRRDVAWHVCECFAGGAMVTMREMTQQKW